VLQPPLEHCDQARTLMLCWVAKACRPPQRSERVRTLVGMVRKALARRFPLKRRVVIRHRFWLFSNRIVLACRYVARFKVPRGRVRRA
jgi:hypothetical protein